jgi:hypothetical protein
MSETLWQISKLSPKSKMKCDWKLTCREFVLIWRYDCNGRRKTRLRFEVAQEMGCLGTDHATSPCWRQGGRWTSFVEAQQFRGTRRW